MHASKHRRGPWSQSEDAYLLQLVQSQGAHNWVRISQLIDSRSPKQCRERFHQNLKPSLNLEPISAEEGVLIERMVAEMGKRWAEIARRLHGRSDNAVKNWWNGGMNRRRRLDSRVQQPARHRQHEPTVYAHEQTTYRSQAYDAPSYASNAPFMSRSTTQTSGSYAPAPLDLAAYHHRRTMEAPLPSPSALSARPESTYGAPSLMSDRSSGSCTQSPCASPRSDRLPPLRLNLEHDLSLPHVQVRSSYDSHWQHHPTQLAPSLPSIKSYEPYQNQRSASPLPFNGQLPLPSFSTFRAPELRAPSPPRDSRMSLNNMIH